jgi:GDP-mannose 6-dehydrogenase
MRISVFGIGYVGAVSAGCLASDGHAVVAVDPNTSKVDLINRGLAPIVERDIGERIRDAVQAGRLRATTSATDAIMDSELSLVCVGTPSQFNGNLDLSYVRRACESIGDALRQKTAYHVVAARSTMLPGSMSGVVIPLLEQASGKRIGVDFGVCYNPEFLREGSAVHDYHHPPKTVVGEADRRAGDVLVSLYAGIDAPLIRTSVEVAEMVKYADNSWHAVKVAYANEIGSLCKAMGIDGQQVMDIFCQDTKLNLSGYYMKPGFAFGGSCLPKDVRALNHKARSLDLELPLLGAILPSNQQQIERAIEMVVCLGRRKVGVLGFAFKAGTDDLRESPMVAVIERLLGKGFDLRVFDRSVNMATITGTNRDYIFNVVPHLSRLMVNSAEEVMDFGEVIVVGNGAEEFRAAAGAARPEQTVVDYVRIDDRVSGPGYMGIAW